MGRGGGTGSPVSEDYGSEDAVRPSSSNFLGTGEGGGGGSEP